MAGIFGYLRGDGDFTLVDSRGFDLASGRIRRIPDSFLTFNLNRDIPNWPWSAPSPWQRISLPPNSGSPGQQTTQDGGLRTRDAWAFDWIHPGPSFTSPACGSAAEGEYSVSFGAGIEIGLEFPDLRSVRVSAAYTEQGPSNIPMNSQRVENPPDPSFVYQVKPLIEVLYFRRIVDFFSPKGFGQLFDEGIFPYSKSYERTLVVQALSYAVARMPCVVEEDLDDSDEDEDGEGSDEEQ
jgi:hypothetical protein